ncbi:hypothetical protein SUGI_0427880 [Cryptomeria japonica]|nr:hypothetical protein SUGI_0427880 [Cryptomeria japonica]
MLLLQKRTPITPGHVKLYGCQGSAVRGSVFSFFWCGGFGCGCAIPTKSVKPVCAWPILGSVDGTLPLNSALHVSDFKSFLKGLVVKIPLLELGMRL